jgi:hypothetical protein
MYSYGMDEDTKQALIERVADRREIGHKLHRVVRIQPASRNPEDLLDPANWESRNWAGYSDGTLLGVSTCGVASDHEVSMGVDRYQYLAGYFANRQANLKNCVVVELDAYEADDRDEDDTDWGGSGFLVWPVAIVSVTPLDETTIPSLITEIEEERGAGYEPWLPSLGQ